MGLEWTTIAAVRGVTVASMHTDVVSTLQPGLFTAMLGCRGTIGTPTKLGQRRYLVVENERLSKDCMRLKDNLRLTREHESGAL
jgi:hypothetical protein